MKTIEVGTHPSYPILIGKGVLSSVGSVCAEKFVRAGKILIVSDSNVAPLYLEPVKASLEQAGFTVCSYVFPAGENSKNVSTFMGIVQTAAKHGLCRDDAIVALGGGVTGDLAGFAAASYMRGICYVQVPTTLLAAIDSSIGGKTGFDVEEGKNLVGAFHQPAAVLFDVDVLKTLPERERKNGLGEGVKYAVLQGGRIFHLLEEGLNNETMEEFCFLCAQCKANIVAADEKESGLRQLLNLGHTPAHAEEKLSGYAVPHGEAVAAGIRMMAKASERQGILPSADFEKILSLLKKYDLDREPLFPASEIAQAAVNDKKNHKNGLNVVELRAIGQCSVRKMTLDEFGEYIR